MLSDPISVTYNGSAKSLPATSTPFRLNVARVIGTRSYNTADGEFTVSTRQSVLRDGDWVSEIYLTRAAPETDTNTVAQGYFSNSVGLSFVTNPYKAGTAVDLPLLRAALLAFVDTTLQGRLIGGEL